MPSSFGWTLLSRDALRRAETQLRDASEGVRDEIGFLALHQAYADRFFPGTSVLHTRLRYVLFVPWLYERILRDTERNRVAAVVEAHEIAIAGRLKHAEQHGVIGGMRYPQPTTQPPSMVYWSALAKWHILRRLPDGSIPSRQLVHRVIAQRRSHPHLHDDDKQLLLEDEPLFNAVPSPPAAWTDLTKQLDFRLELGERRFLRNCFLAVDRPDGDGTSSLLSRLVERCVPMSDRIDLWSPRVMAAADSFDREALIRAKQAAALSAIGRGIYAAMVEEIRERQDGVLTANIHRSNLDAVVERFSAEALKLNVDAVAIDAPKLPSGFLDVLRKTHAWLQTGMRDLAPLCGAYERAEILRKGRRARLARNLAGRARRAEWLPEEHPLAAPLHYRWENVRQLLLDLQEAP